MDIPVKFDDDAEEGEVGPVDDYDPALEFPGNDEVSEYLPNPRISSPSPPAVPAVNRTTTCRLVVLKSSILSRSKRIAVLDGHAEVSIGRDAIPSARIRLKELAVSKFHASIYWDGSRREWGIVDRGSMHGTFVRSAQDPSTSASGSHASPGIRLSQPRQSSMPRVLRHMDQITVGGTTFLVHEHLDGRPCLECTIDDNQEIPLSSSHESTSGNNRAHHIQRKRKPELSEEERDPKRAMAKLKSSLMSRHQPNDIRSSGSYKDRSALRRQLHPERAPMPPTPATLPDIKFQSITVPVPLELPSPPRPPSPPPPVSSNNVGHKLLLLQGWRPGTALGEDPSSGLTEPLNLTQNASRAGLGTAPAMPSSHVNININNWKEEARQRRWDDSQSR